MAEDGVHEVVGGIAAEGEERGIGRILALGGVKGLGFIDKSLVSCASVNRSSSPRHLLHHPSANQFAIGVLAALDAILAPGAPLLEEEGGVEGLVLFHQLACLCPIEISFRQTNTQLVQFARKNGFNRQIVCKLCIGESFNIFTTCFYQCGKICCFSCINNSFFYAISALIHERLDVDDALL